jgi:hypothetical protein
MAVVHPKVYNVRIFIDDEQYIMTTIGAAKLCKLYRDEITDDDGEDDAKRYAFKIERLRAEDLPLFKQFIEHHEDHSALDIAHPMTSANESDHLSLFDMNFLRDENNKYDIEQVIRFLNAANFADCETMLNVCLAKMICFCATKSEDEVKEAVVTQPMSNQELNRVRKNNSWLFRL